MLSAISHPLSESFPAPCYILSTEHESLFVLTDPDRTPIKRSLGRVVVLMKTSGVSYLEAVHRFQGCIYRPST